MTAKITGQYGHLTVEFEGGNVRLAIREYESLEQWVLSRQTEEEE